MKRINISLPDLTVEQLNYLKNVRGISISEIVRRYVDACITSDLKMYSSYQDSFRKGGLKGIVVDTSVELNDLL